MVPKYSAVVFGAVNSEEVSIPGNHITMVKYQSPEDEAYKKVAGRISLMAQRASQLVKSLDAYGEPIGSYAAFDDR
jgi:hypothetical protein